MEFWPKIASALILVATLVLVASCRLPNRPLMDPPRTQALDPRTVP